MTVEIGPRAQSIALLAIVGLVVAAIAAQAPEIKRYLKVRSM
jgi:hypothetical protein